MPINTSVVQSKPQESLFAQKFDAERLTRLVDEMARSQKEAHDLIALAMCKLNAGTDEEDIQILQRMQMWLKQSRRTSS